MNVRISVITSPMATDERGIQTWMCITFNGIKTNGIKAMIDECVGDQNVKIHVV